MKLFHGFETLLAPEKAYKECESEQQVLEFEAGVETGGHIYWK